MEQGARESGRRFWDLTEGVIGAAVEVHRALGPGLLESVYETCLCRELELRGLAFARQRQLPVVYKGRTLDASCRLDVVVEEHVVIEIKSVEALTRLHEAQLITYLKLAKIPIGLLINFNVPKLTNGIRRLSHIKNEELDRERGS